VTEDNRPIVAVTVGDEAGIGPEVVAKALSRRDVYEWCRPLTIGSMDVMQHTIDGLGLSCSLRRVERPREGCYQLGTIDLIDMGGLVWGDFALGQVQSEVGRAAMGQTEAAVRLALSKEIDAICSAPVNKDAMHQAGYSFPGQTEFFAHLTGARHYAMMLSFGEIRVFFVTNHVSMRQACDLITKSRVLDVVRVANQALQDLGIVNRLIGVAGLNPHCGEHGRMGTEEIDCIIPALDEARKWGFAVEGPIPGDIIFARAKEGRYGAVVAMYHDQGNAPIKLLGHHAAVTVVVGLPIVRTSVAHGTAYDIVGRGLADPSTIVEAIRSAAQFAAARRQE
jgi:4-hydroxythreonine-4-phosphate dehydrogenase